MIKAVTELLQQVLNKNPATTVVVIDEVNTDNWGIGAEQLTELRNQAAQKLSRPGRSPTGSVCS